MKNSKKNRFTAVVNALTLTVGTKVKIRDSVIHPNYLSKSMDPDEVGVIGRVDNWARLKKLVYLVNFDNFSCWYKAKDIEVVDE